MRKKGFKQLKSDIRYLGIKNGYGKIFRRKDKLKKEGFMYVRKVYRLRPRLVEKKDIPTEIAKEPHFNLHIQPYIVE